MRESLEWRFTLALLSQASPRGHGTCLYSASSKSRQLAKVSIWQVSHGSRWLLGPGSVAQPSCPGVSSEMARISLGVTGTTGWNWEVGPGWGLGVCCFLGDSVSPAQQSHLGRERTGAPRTGHRPVTVGK